MSIVLITPENMLQQPGTHVDLLREAGFEIQYPKDPTFTRGLLGMQATVEELRGAAAVIAGGEYITEEAMTALPDLRVISRSGVGYDRVDVAAATARRIAVTITPTANHEAVAEQALALLFAVAKTLVWRDKQLRAGHWEIEALKPVREQTLGIFGLGRIGRSLAVRAIAMGMHVIATELYPNDEFVRTHQIELIDFDALLARSDYLSLNCPLNDETRQMFNKDVFRRMKPGSVLINTARGGLVVEADLLDALQSGHLWAAGLDVFEQEPALPDNPLFALDNVVVSPHIAGNDELSSEHMGIEAAQNIVKLSQGQWPQGAVVNDELKQHWKW